MNSRINQQQDFDVGSLYAGAYLKTDDLAGKTYQTTIAAVESVQIREGNGGMRERAALTLTGMSAKLLLNKTNYEAIAATYGRRSAGWIGKPLEVYPDTTLLNGCPVPCIRVRARQAAPSMVVHGNPLPPGVLAAALGQNASESPAQPSGDVSDVLPR